MSFAITNSPAGEIQRIYSQKKYSRVAVLADGNTRKHCYPHIQAQLEKYPVIEIAAGEEQKTIQTCEVIWGEMTNLGFDRHSLLIVLGGGVPGDMGGFCAATFKRGIDFVLVPTTLLSMVDAAIGGKTGIDFRACKNHIGVFSLPVKTIISPLFLETLPERELRSGFAEVIKHCLLSDANEWNEIRKHDFKNQNWNRLIAHSVAYKTKITESDPTEKGERKLLNLGHTLGHALESFYLPTPHRIFHGEAIATGLILESIIALRKQMISPEVFREIDQYLRKIYEPFMPLPAVSELMAVIRQDKKNKGDSVLMSLLTGIGKAVWDVEVSEEEIEESFKSF